MSSPCLFNTETPFDFLGTDTSFTFSGFGNSFQVRRTGESLEVLKKGIPQVIRNKDAQGFLVAHDAIETSVFTGSSKEAGDAGLSLLDTGEVFFGDKFWGHGVMIIT